MSDGKFSIPRESIPANWSICRVEDVGTVQLGRQRSPKDHNGPNMRPYLRAANVFEDCIDTSDVKEMNFTPEEFENFRLREGDILLNEGQSLELVGRPAMFRGEVADCCFQNTLVRFVPASVLDGRFALKLFQHYMRNGRFQKIARWTTNIAHLGASRFAELEIPLPPLAEQKRIVAKIEELFSELEAGEESLRVARRQLGVYRQSLLKQAFEGKLTEKWRTKNRTKLEPTEQLLARILALRQSGWTGRGTYSDPAQFADGVFEQLPKDWRMLSLEAATSAARPICYGILMPKENVANGVLYVKVRDMKGDRIELSGLQRTSPEIAAQYARASLREGDLLLSIRGTYGRIAVIPKELEGGNITQDSARLAVSPLLNRDFVRWAIRSQQIQHYFKRVARGVAVKGVNIGDVRPTPIPLPPLPEQQEIVRLLDEQFEVIERNEREIDAALQRSEALRQAILKKAFTGRLVPQFPADEPAVTLLARLRAERSGTSSSSSSRSRSSSSSSSSTTSSRSSSSSIASSSRLRRHRASAEQA